MFRNLLKTFSQSLRRLRGRGGPGVLSLFGSVIDSIFSSSPLIFTCKHDELLLTEIQHQEPYAAEFGTVTETWDNIARALRQCKEVEFGNVDGTRCKKRFTETLLPSYRDDNYKSRGASGVAEDYSAVKQLLTDIDSRMKDAESKPKADSKTAKKTHDAQKARFVRDSAVKRLGGKRPFNAFEHEEEEEKEDGRVDKEASSSLTPVKAADGNHGEEHEEEDEERTPRGKRRREEKSFQERILETKQLELKLLQEKAEREKEREEIQIKRAKLELEILEKQAKSTETKGDTSTNNDFQALSSQIKDLMALVTSSIKKE